MILSRLPHRVRFPVRVAGALAWTSLVPVAHRTHRRLRPAPDPVSLREHYTQQWGAGLARWMGVQLIVLPEPPAPYAGPRLVVANHRSALEIPILLKLFGGSLLSRQDLGKWPVIGWAAREGGTFFVDRHDPDSRERAVEMINERLRDGRTVSVFPEGTTLAGDEVRRFAKGAFSALEGTGALVQPVGFAHPPGTEFVEPDFMSHAANVARRARVQVAVGEPFVPEGSANEVASRAQQAVQALVNQARRSLG